MKKGRLGEEENRIIAWRELSVEVEGKFKCQYFCACFRLRKYSEYTVYVRRVSYIIVRRSFESR